MTKKNSEIQVKRFLKINNEEIFEAKQRIAIEKFGSLYEDEVFFALEIAVNTELDHELNSEYYKRLNMYKKMN
ncbi:hypothetical protein [Peptostreptococcus faecalis]|uniref:hypothetical protein n=1 Tax=Peptostreptococcus faecalis TaxID=2045015 RepID=UPI000C7B257E|nr:hypothetical protein [Peptostreptococcus faecalis]